jgi:hypothetical protein
MTATDIVTIVIVLTCAGAFSLILLQVCALALRRAARRRAGAERRPPLVTASTPFIEMPLHLKTRQEMVDWMQHDLPRQTAGLILTDRD